MEDVKYQSKNADDAFNSDPDRPVFDDHDSGQ